MAGHAGPLAGLCHWWQRHPRIGLYCGWFLIGAVVLGYRGCGPIPPRVIGIRYVYGRRPQRPEV
jgi:hypothetical protein